MTDQSPQLDERLNAYLDDRLSADDRVAFEAQMEADPELRCVVDLQRRIDTSLARSFPEPSPAEFKMPAPSSVPGGIAGSRGPAPRWRRWLVAAVLIMVSSVAIAFLAQSIISPAPGTGSRARTETFAQTFQRTVSEGFKPGWVCETEQEFADSFRQRVERPVLLRELPSDVVATGLAYSLRSMSAHTLMLLARVDDTPVMVFVDQQANDPGDLDEEAPGLHIHRRELDTLVLYEVSSLPTPRVLDHLYIPD
jgi:hypothetical protein